MPALICILVAYASITGLQFIAIATFLNLMFGLNTTTRIIIGCIFLTFKTYIGGLKAVIWSDSVQGTIQTLGIIILFFTVYSFSGGWDTVKENALAISSSSFNSLNFSRNPKTIANCSSVVSSYIFKYVIECSKYNLWMLLRGSMAKLDSS